MISVISLLLIVIGTNAINVQFEFGENLQSQVVQTRLTNWVKELQQQQQKGGRNAKKGIKLNDEFPNKKKVDDLPASNIFISFGNTSTTRTLIGEEELLNLGSEGFIVRSNYVSSNSTLFLVTDGNALVSNTSLSKSNIGVLFGSYEILKSLGFVFYHPLQPLSPSLSTLGKRLQSIISKSLNVSEAPYWNSRGFHYHSMHPLELTNFFNGFDTDAQTWDSMMPEYENYVEWYVANRQNRMEFVLLYATEWANFAMSALRQQRLSSIVSLGHEFGLVIGADRPVCEQQQHAWYIVTADGNQQQEIQQQLDWTFQCGFDFLSTESGFSEFTHPNDTKMLEWMNGITDYADKQWNRPVFIKCHCSTGQTCPDYQDPWKGGPLNFNFLPHYADPRLGVMPHTVQVYSFDDPAPTYGNQNFSYMFDFIFHEVGLRPVIYHSETAYWVNYDIDVPLMLMPYLTGRFYDYRKIAQKEISLAQQIDGVVVFDSGFEWGYWLNDVFVASIAWNPRMDISDFDEAFNAILTEIFQPFCDEYENCNDFPQLFSSFATNQYELMVLGQKQGQEPPENIVDRNGLAYLIGWDTWAEVGGYAGISTQPSKLGIERVRLPFQNPNYGKEIRPLLSQMADNFTFYSQSFTNLAIANSTTVQPVLSVLMSDLVDTMNITAQRAVEVYHLYEYAAGWLIHDGKWRQKQLDQAIEALKQAQQIVANRESEYRVPVERISGWAITNPTSYHYGYLWTVHSLFYWFRDLEKALEREFDSLSPCFRNIINPVDVAFGEGIFFNATEIAREVVDALGFGAFFADCLSFPPAEPHYNYTDTR